MGRVHEVHRLAVGLGRGDEEVDRQANRCPPAGDFVTHQRTAARDQPRLPGQLAPQGPAALPAIGAQHDIQQHRGKPDPARVGQRHPPAQASVEQVGPVLGRGHAQLGERRGVDGKAVTCQLGRLVQVFLITQRQAADLRRQALQADTQRLPTARLRQPGEVARRRRPVHIHPALSGLQQVGQGIEALAPEDLQAILRVGLGKAILHPRHHLLGVAGHHHHALRGRAQQAAERQQQARQPAVTAAH